MHSNYTKLIQFVDGFLDELGLAFGAGPWVVLHYYVHCIVAEDALGWDFSARDLRKRLRKEGEDFLRHPNAMHVYAVKHDVEVFELATNLQVFLEGC